MERVKPTALCKDCTIGDAMACGLKPFIQLRCDEMVEKAKKQGRTAVNYNDALRPVITNPGDSTKAAERIMFWASKLPDTHTAKHMQTLNGALNGLRVIDDAINQQITVLKYEELARIEQLAASNTTSAAR
jgi:hypothetical protein